jgi:RluA family pseudouridine synthase
VHVAPPPEGASTPERAPRILASANDLVAVEKPAGIPTIPDHAGSAHALVAAVARALGTEPARLHPTSRLDRGVSGVVIFALTKAAAERLSGARARGEYRRRYVAIAVGAPTPARGVWDAPLGRGRDPRLRVVAGRDAVPARTRYATCSVARAGASLLAVEPITGRTHQIRVHAANARVPLVGDGSYGGPVRMTLAGGRVVEPKRIALHAARVLVPDARGGILVATSPVPDALVELWSALGGESGAWEVSTSCVLD